MGIFKVSIYQKSLNDGLNLSIQKKLAALKSDFLVFPEYFYADSSVKNLKNAQDKSQYALDWLLKLNDGYKGIIIGGSVILKEDGKFFSATPIISDGAVVDWYRKRTITESESKILSPGTESGIFILGGHRFAVLMNDDMRNPEYIKELADMGIRIIFAIMNDESQISDREEDEETYFLKPARDYGLYISKCSSSGDLFGNPIIGRSMVSTPNGVSWRVAPQEEGKEILKTVMLTVAG